MEQRQVLINDSHAYSLFSFAINVSGPELAGKENAWPGEGGGIAQRRSHREV